MHKWVMSFDLNSLYPHLIMQYNLSPETLVSGEFIKDLTVDTVLKGVEFQSTRQYNYYTKRCIVS